MVQVPVLERVGNVAFEGFAAGDQINRAKAALQECLRGAQAAADSVRAAPQLGNCTPMNLQRLRQWFGLKVELPAHAALYNQLRNNLIGLQTALQTRPITLVYRPDIQLKHAPADRNLPLEPVNLGDGRAFSGQNVYGYVQNHQAGSGYRIVCGALFHTDRTPYYASTTIYHELTHKHCQTKDHVYGDLGCKQLAVDSAARAIDNADNYAYYVISLLSRRI